ncbi:MAG: glycine--tRNA ligase subunit beta, partial [bacterium]
MPVELLFEIGCEEIPARFLEPALKQLREKAQAELEKNRIKHGELNTYGTPRRMALAVYDVAEHQQSAREK